MHGPPMRRTRDPHHPEPVLVMTSEPPTLTPAAAAVLLRILLRAAQAEPDDGSCHGEQVLS